jgi:hypothetical protein
MQGKRHTDLGWVNNRLDFARKQTLFCSKAGFVLLESRLCFCLTSETISLKYRIPLIFRRGRRYEANWIGIYRITRLQTLSEAGFTGLSTITIQTIAGASNNSKFKIQNLE